MLLKVGSNGENVKKLQIKLGIKDDGDFGNETEIAVKKFQSMNGIPPTGIVNDITWDKIFVGLIKGDFIDKLKGHVPDLVYSQIRSTCERFNITTPLRLAHFLGQCGHESANFKLVNENLNYSEKGLKSVFSKYFPGTLAKQYEKKPQMIASRVYGSRMGNGPESTGEGWKFRGRGYIQLTGKQNYEKFTKFIGEDCVSNPDLVSTKYPLASAAFFFNINDLWKICDEGINNDVITKLTKRINGGKIGLEDRIKHTMEFYELMSH